jgi:hypothetical protein
MWFEFGWDQAATVALRMEQISPLRRVIPAVMSRTSSAATQYP